MSQSSEESCSHERTFSLGGKCSDRAYWTWPSGESGDGYVPQGLGLGGGDYIDVEVCIDCAKVIGLSAADVFLQEGE